MEAITLTRKDYEEGVERVAKAASGGTSYLGQFEVTFPDGMNTANTLEICRAISESDMDAKIRLLRICIAGKNVNVKCPNGEIEKFCLSSPDGDFSALPLFQKDPTALLAIADCVYGYILKKYIRLSKPQRAEQKA